MLNFLAIFTATDASRARSNWSALSESEVAQKRAADVAAWNDWMARHEAAIVDPGSPIGKTKQVDPGGVSEGHGTRLFEGHGWRRRLTLAESRFMNTGAVQLRYQVLRPR